MQIHLARCETEMLSLTPATEIHNYSERLICLNSSSRHVTLSGTSGTVSTGE